MPPDRTFLRQGFGLKDVQNCARQMAAIQRRDQILFDQMTTPRDIDYPGAPGSWAKKPAFIMPLVSSVIGNTQTQ